MITAALLDCGADRERVVSAMRAVVAEPTVETVTRAGIQATKVHTRATPAHRSLSDVYKRLDDAAPPCLPKRLRWHTGSFRGSTRQKRKSTGPTSISTKSGPTMQSPM